MIRQLEAFLQKNNSVFAKYLAAIIVGIGIGLKVYADDSSLNFWAILGGCVVCSMFAATILIMYDTRKNR